MTKEALVVVLVLGLISVAHLSGQSINGSLFEEVRPWLPNNIEVVYATNLPLRGLVSGRTASASVRYSQLTSAPIDLMQDRSLAESFMANLSAGSALYVGRGLRFLDTPNGLGLKTRFDGCSFFGSTANTVALAFASASKNNVGTSNGDGLILVRSGESGSDALAISAVEPEMLMVCTDRTMASEILDRKSQGAYGTAFRANAPEWRWVNTSAPVWGIRWFTLETPNDPTSPLNSRSAGLLPRYYDPGAVAMTFALDADKSAKVTYLTRRRGRAVNYGRVWNRPAASSHEIGYQVVNIKFDPSNDIGSEMLSRVRLTLLGLLLVV